MLFQFFISALNAMDFRFLEEFSRHWLDLNSLGVFLIIWISFLLNKFYIFPILERREMLKNYCRIVEFLCVDARNWFSISWMIHPIVLGSNTEFPPNNNLSIKTFSSFYFRLSAGWAKEWKDEKWKTINQVEYNCCEEMRLPQCKKFSGCKSKSKKVSNHDF